MKLRYKNLVLLLTCLACPVWGIGNKKAQSNPNWVYPPILVSIGSKTYKLVKVRSSGMWAVTTANEQIVRDPSILKKVFFVKYVYLPSYYRGRKMSLRVVNQLDTEINRLQTGLNYSTLADAFLFTREV